MSLPRHDHADRVIVLERANITSGRSDAGSKVRKELPDISLLKADGNMKVKHRLVPPQQLYPRSKHLPIKGVQRQWQMWTLSAYLDLPYHYSTILRRHRRWHNRLPDPPTERPRSLREQAKSLRSDSQAKYDPQSPYHKKWSPLS